MKAKLKHAIQENTEVDTLKAEQYTVGQWMDIWFENYAKIKVRPSSHQTYRGYIDNHIKPNIGKIPLGKLTTLELQKLYKKLLSKDRIDRIEAKDSGVFDQNSLFTENDPVPALPVPSFSPWES